MCDLNFNHCSYLRDIGKMFSLLTYGFILDPFKDPELTAIDLCDGKQKLHSFLVFPISFLKGQVICSKKKEEKF